MFGQGFFFGGSPNSYQEIPIETMRIQGENILYVPLGEETEKEVSLLNALYALEDGHVQKINGNMLAGKLIDGKEISMDIAELAGRQKEFHTNKRFLLGTDTFGRDMLSRLMGGVIFSLSVGFISVLISLIIGISLGAIAKQQKLWAIRSSE